MSNNILLPGTTLSVESEEQGSGSGIQRQVTQALPADSAGNPLTNVGGALSSGAATIPAPTTPTKFRYVQNLDTTAPMTMTLGTGGPTFLLAPAGSDGDWWSTGKFGFLYLGAIFLTSSTLTAAFAAGQG